MDAVFNLNVNQHYHVQYQEVYQAGGLHKPHWDQLEFWPLQVCMVFVHKHALICL